MRMALYQRQRVSVSRSTMAINDRDRAYFDRGGDDDDQIDFIDLTTDAIFGNTRPSRTF
jgi:hypothetical protein